MKMKAKRMISLLMAAILSLSILATPAMAASGSDEMESVTSVEAVETDSADSTADAAPQSDTQNSAVSIRLKAEGDLVYGSPFTLSVETKPADTQYIGVIIGTSGSAKGYVTLVLSDKIRTLLKMVPLPRKMSKTPDQEEEFNVYYYLKQLIDGNDVEVLLRVADEVVSVMDTLKFYMPTLKDVSTGLKLAVELIRKFLPKGVASRIYLDEQPVDAGGYVAGAVALESGDMNTAGVAMFKIKPKTEGVRLYWASDLPETLTVEEAANFNGAAVLDDNGTIVTDGNVTCTYQKGDGSFLSGLFNKKSSTFPTAPGKYTEVATVKGNYSTTKITRTIVIK